MNNLYIIWEQCSSAFKKQGPDVLSGRGEGTAGGGGGGGEEKDYKERLHTKRVPFIGWKKIQKQAFCENRSFQKLF